MTAFVAANYMNNAGRTEAEMKQAFEDNLAATKQLLGGVAQSTLTLVSDQITPTGAFHLVDTQAAAATDNLAQILQSNLPDGSWLMLGIVSASRTVVFKHAAGGTGQLTMLASVDVTVDNITTFLSFQRRGTLWEERQRFYGNAVTAFKTFYQVAGLGQNTFTGRQEWKKGADLTTATTLALGTDGNYFSVLGSATAITSIASAPAGTPIRLAFQDFATLTHNATSLRLSPPVTRIMIPGETVDLVSEGSGNWREFRPYLGTIDSGTGSAHNASQAETVVYQFTVPAKTLGLKRRLRFEAHCNVDWRNNAADTLTVRMKYGPTPTTIATVTVADPGGTAAGHPIRLTGWLSENNSLALQLGVLTVDGVTNPAIASGHGGLAVDATVAQFFQITAQFIASGSPAGVVFNVMNYFLELL